MLSFLSNALLPNARACAAVTEACAHCGLSLPAVPVEHDDGLRFCCPGCSAVYAAIQSAGLGEFYGVKGHTWMAPPILDDPDRTIRRGNRRFRLYYDGKRLRLVAWRTKRGVYWISNTLTQSIGEAQMIAIASSLKRLKQ